MKVHKIGTHLCLKWEEGDPLKKKIKLSIIIDLFTADMIWGQARVYSVEHWKQLHFIKPKLFHILFPPPWRVKMCGGKKFCFVWQVLNEQKLQSRNRIKINRNSTGPKTLSYVETFRNMITLKCAWYWVFQHNQGQCSFRTEKHCSMKF